MKRTEDTGRRIIHSEEAIQDDAGGCAGGIVETEAAPGSGTGTAGEVTDAGTESVGPDETASAWRYQGSGTVTGSDALTEGQQEILLEFMDAYYQSMAELEVQDCSGLFIEDGGHEQFRAQVDGTSWTAVTDNQTQEDGCVQVEVMEYADMRFAHTPDTDSSVTGLDGSGFFPGICPG